jgi:hypothetical protein
MNEVKVALALLVLDKIRVIRSLSNIYVKHHEILYDER